VDFAVHDIDGLITHGKDVVRWEKVLEMISLGEMPPRGRTTALQGRSQQGEGVDFD
jgi:hypothetical protein